LLGSTEQWLMTLNHKLQYPVSALHQQLQGTVLVAYTVNPDGHTSDYTIESSLSADCDQEVWRALKELPDNWIPAVYQGRPAATRFYLAVQFKMMDQASFQRQQREQERSFQAEPAVAPLVTKPSYVQQVEVVAVGVERNSRNELIGRQPR
jgi:TonB family protein